MKRIITAAVLLIVLSFGCFGAYRYVDHTTAKLDTIAGEVFDQLKADNFDAARSKMNEGYAAWHRLRRPLSALVRHNELDDIDRLYQRTQQALDNEDRDESLLQLRELRAMLRHLPEMETPSYSNLF